MNVTPTTFRAWAHQGGAKEAPSNTLAAMKRAHRPERPERALELDVHCSWDDHLVVIHDRTVSRTTSGSGKVRRLTLDALRQFDAGHWWVDGAVDDHAAPPEAYLHRGKGPEDPDYRIPTLAEVLDLFPVTPLTIEIKSWRAARPLADELAARRHPDVTVTSFSDPIVWRFRWRSRRHRPWRASLAPGTLATLWWWVRLLVAGGGRSSYDRLQIPDRRFGIRFATRRLVDAAHAAGLAVDVWTIDDEPTMRRLLDLGVDGIMTDRPTALRRVLDEADGASGPAAAGPDVVLRSGPTRPPA